VETREPKNRTYGVNPKNPDPFETDMVGHPKKPNQSLGVEVLEWYQPTVCLR
jgi:hypothetical protein